jgi:hypothetical protein
LTVKTVVTVKALRQEIKEFSKEDNVMPLLSFLQKIIDRLTYQVAPIESSARLVGEYVERVDLITRQAHADLR